MNNKIMASINNMPLDIWREILVRLPAESVIRTRAVSKVFRAVIDDPCFVRAHTNNLQHQQHSSNVVIVIYSSAEGSCYSLDLEALIRCSSSNDGHQAIAATPLDLGFLRDSPPSSSWAVAACNGLVLTDEPLTIWNPLTRERLELPPARDFKHVWAFGLGYDGATDDYKAVAILRSRETHVYSLKPGSWRSIMNCPCDGDLWGPFGPGVFVCGGLNWLSTREGGEYDDKIVALDIGTEKYRLLQMPPRSPPLNGDMLLSVLSGCLALCDSGYESHLNVWVMKDYGDDDSWIKLFSIDWERNVSLWFGFLRPVAFIMKEKLLVFLQDSYERFFLFDVETKSFKWVKIDGSIIGKGWNVYATQMILGTVFRLQAKCAGARKSCKKKKRNCTKKKKASAEDVELVFCVRDANGTYNVSCSERGCLSGEDEDW